MIETWTIGNVPIQGKAILAPMAGVSDIAYRLLAKEHGASMVCTEMVSAMGIKMSARMSYCVWKRSSILYRCKFLVPIQKQ